MAWILAITSLLHLLMIWGEVSLTHATAHARLAVWEMVSGRYKSDFWIGASFVTCRRTNSRARADGSNQRLPRNCWRRHWR